jgi:hypothetical protein
VFKKWKKEWKTFQEAPAGERFQRRYRDRKQGGSAWVRIATIGLGLVLIVGGAILLVIPGPGLLVIAFGGALIAQEFRWAAAALDWTEVALRKGARRARRFWKSASIAVKGLVVAFAAGVAAGAAYLAWTWLFR